MFGLFVLWVTRKQFARSSAARTFYDPVFVSSMRAAEPGS
jgi:hypothetical protein